jgi:hypothetical protein
MTLFAGSRSEKADGRILPMWASEFYRAKSIPDSRYGHRVFYLGDPRDWLAAAQ